MAVVLSNAERERNTNGPKERKLENVNATFRTLMLQNALPLKERKHIAQHDFASALTVCAVTGHTWDGHNIETQTKKVHAP